MPVWIEGICLRGGHILGEGCTRLLVEVQPVVVLVFKRALYDEGGCSRAEGASQRLECTACRHDVATNHTVKHYTIVILVAHSVGSALGSWPRGMAPGEEESGMPQSRLKNLSSSTRAGWISAPPSDHVSERKKQA